MDGPAALKRAQELSARSFSSSDRRKYFEHLLTLPSFNTSSTSAYYANSITRDFSEFEDLQDQAVDAVLDLCEDENEQTRISGIKALAEIGRVEPKWVRGNTGVLVQLLECPPGELSHVHKALFDLLEVSPSDVFSMMAEDCKPQEEGGSRHSILHFLTIDARKQRKEILESGNNVEVEYTFSTGFYEVLSTTNKEETVQVLEMLMGLSTVSGKNATRDTMGRFARALTNSLRVNGSVEAIGLWDEFTTKAIDLDPRWTIYFLAQHGTAVVQAALDKNDIAAKRILEFINTHTPSRWRRYLEDREDRNLEAKTLIPRFAQTILEAALANQSTTNLTTLEQVFLSVYTLITLDRTTRDYIPTPLSRKLQDFGVVADRKKRSAKEAKFEQCWRNIRDMAEIMGDRRRRVIDIEPSWAMRERSRSPVRIKEPAAPITHLAQSVKTNSSNVSREAPIRPAQPSGIPSVQSRPTSNSTPIPSMQVISRPVAAAPKKPTVAAVKPDTPAQGLSIKARSTVSSTTPASLSTNQHTPIPPAAVSAAQVQPSPGLSIRARATQTPPTPQSQAITQEPSQGFSIRSVSSLPSLQNPNPRPASLLSRLSSSSNTPPTSMNKRPRNDNDDNQNTSIEEPAPAPGRRSLADRLGSGGQVVDKRQKVIKDESPISSPSLLSRMSTTLSTPASTSMPSNKMDQISHSGFTLRRTGTVQTQPPVQVTAPVIGGFNIRNRSTEKIRYPLPDPSSPPATQGFSIRKSQPVPSTEAMIVNETSLPDDDTPVIRKGRGFAAKQHEELLITPPTPPFAPHQQGQSGRFGGLRFGPR